MTRVLHCVRADISVHQHKRAGVCCVYAFSVSCCHWWPITGHNSEHVTSTGSTSPRRNIGHYGDLCDCAFDVIVFSKHSLINVLHSLIGVWSSKKPMVHSLSLGRAFDDSNVVDLKWVYLIATNIYASWPKKTWSLMTHILNILSFLHSHNASHIPNIDSFAIFSLLNFERNSELLLHSRYQIDFKCLQQNLFLHSNLG